MAKQQLSQISMFDLGAVEEPAKPKPVTMAVPVPEIKEAEPEEEPAIEEPVIIAAPPAIAVKAKKSVKSTRGRRSLKEIGENAELLQIPEDEVLFQKQYYSIGDVAIMFRENQSLIRYWETEFDILQPRKNRKGDRFFRPVDIKNLVLIYDLLRRRKFTIEGAKDFLKKNKKADEKFVTIQSLKKIKGFLLELKASL
jgi:DNA-binding transcriptional MerR regulator